MVDGGRIVVGRHLSLLLLLLTNELRLVAIGLVLLLLLLVLLLVNRLHVIGAAEMATASTLGLRVADAVVLVQRRVEGGRRAGRADGRHRGHLLRVLLQHRDRRRGRALAISGANRRRARGAWRRVGRRREARLLLLLLLLGHGRQLAGRVDTAHVVVVRVVVGVMVVHESGMRTCGARGHGGCGRVRMVVVVGSGCRCGRRMVMVGRVMVRVHRRMERVVDLGVMVAGRHDGLKRM